ncbi:MAG TPA: response regulator [Cyclobacteriaceae bacterium]|nr:response regulator [Cyclobacteriaceae bacterium]
MTNIKRILLADDDRDDIDLLCEALNLVDPSIVCEVAKHGEDALNILTSSSKERPHLIFLDVNMPVLDGWECLRIIKTYQHLKDIPVVIYSTSSNREDKEKAFNLGACCFMTKPDRFTVLERIISVMITTPAGNWSSELNNFKGITFNGSKIVGYVKIDGKRSR